MFSFKYPDTVIQINDNTPKICLNMIVKNESRVIIRLLESVVNIVDGYCICDTGSTDNTISLITEYFKKHNIPGKIVEEPFRDFGYNRTFALKAAAEIPNMDYLLLLDADMILTGSYLQPENIKNFKKGLTKDFYHICQGSQTYFYKNVRIVKNYRDFSYWGVTHEYVKTPPDAISDSFDNNTLFINDIGDGGAKTDKFERDIRLLTKGLEENPNNDRYTFYLANSLKDACHYERAIEMYRNRIKIGGWVEEVWYSYYNIGKCYVILGEMEKAICIWMEGYDFYPKRLEAIYEIVKYYREHGKNKLAYLYYVIADKSRTKWGASSEYLFLQKDIYDYKLDYEMTIIGYYANDDNYNLNRLSMDVIRDPYVDNGISKNVLNNYKFYCKKLIRQNYSSISKHNMAILENATKSLGITESGEYVTSTPSIIIKKSNLIVNVRYVNYRIDDKGNYINQEKIKTKNAIAVIDISTPIWKNTKEFELKYDRTIDEDANNYYVGLEDIRLFTDSAKESADSAKDSADSAESAKDSADSKDSAESANESNDSKTIYYNSNRGLSHGNMVIENGIIDLHQESTIQNKCLKKENQHTIEKNWVIIPSDSASAYNNDRLTVIYNWSPKLSIGNIIDGEFIETHQINTPSFFKYLRGSTNGVLINGDIWLICHAVSYEERRYYYHIVVVLDKDTYELKSYTPFFTFEGEKVEYTLGFQYLENEESLLIGYSVYDKSTKYMNIKLEYLKNEMIMHQ
jgi:tetratricopeptide (TPR) repeat protein